MEISDGIALVALAVAGLSFREARKSNASQSNLTNREIELVRIQIQSAQSDAKHNKTANVSARLIKMDKTNWRLKVFNKGPAIAERVRLELNDQNDIVRNGFADGKFPMAKLEPGQFVELPASVHMQSNAKETLKIVWDDASGENRENSVELTI